MSTNDGGPAFPRPDALDDEGHHIPFSNADGMSIREYAAIHLRVPMSDCKWLDDMIHEAHRNKVTERAVQGIMSGPLANPDEKYHLRDWFAGQALAGLASSDAGWDFIAHGAYAAADAMLAARNGVAK